MLRTLIIAGLAAAAAACAAVPPEPRGPASMPTAAAASEGFSADGLAALDAHFAELAEARTRAGFVIGIARDGRIVHTFATGMQDIEAGAPMSLESRFRLASMSKPVTVAAVMTLVDADKIDLDDPVSVYIPNMANMLVATSETANAEGGFDAVPQDPPMTIRHLATHTSGLGYALASQSDLDRAYLEGTLYDGEGDLEASINQLTALPLYFQPGERWSYSWGVDVLGRVVEAASGMAFEDYLEAEIFAPLGMTSTHFYRTPEDEGLLTTVYGAGEDGGLEPRANLTFGSGAETWPSGGGGLISSMPDYLRFASMLANGGELDGVRVLSPEAVAEMGSGQLTPDQYPAPSSFGGTFLGWTPRGRNFGLGVIVTTDAAASDRADRDGDFGWNGAYSTDWFASPSTGIAAVLMVANQGGPPADTLGDFRQYVYGAFEE